MPTAPLLGCEAAPDELDLPELDEIVLKQIENFKPIVKLRNPVNVHEITEGTLLELDVDDEAPEEAMEYDPFDNLEELDEEEEQNLLPLSHENFQDISGNGGVLKKVTKLGTGAATSANALCRVHYSAYVEGDVEPFDSSRMRNRHAFVSIGKSGDGLSGLQLALLTMRVGEHATFTVRSDYAYGRLGCPPRIPPCATVIFDIELISFVSQNDENNRNVDDPSRRAWQREYKRVQPIHEEANDCFKHGDYRRALAKYGKALRIAGTASLYSEQDEVDMNAFCVKIYLNVSLCSLKLGRYKYVISMCQRALALQPGNIKAIFRLAQAHRLNANYQKAKNFLLEARRLAPLNCDICAELVSLSRDIQNYKDSMKKMCQSMFGTADSESNSKLEEYDALAEHLQEVDENISLLFEEKLKLFSEDPDTSQIVLPNLYLDNELSVIRAFSKKYGLKMTTERRCVILKKGSSSVSFD